MGLRIFGAIVAGLLIALVVRRYRRGQLRRDEAFIAFIAAIGLAIAGLKPSLFDPILEIFGFQPGNQRRIIILLVLSQIFTLLLLFRNFSRLDAVAGSLNGMVDYGALRRLEAGGWNLIPGGCAVVVPAYNEAENLPSVLSEMPARVCGLAVQTIVVSDGSIDGTEEVAARFGATVLQLDLRRGQGAAIRLGYLVGLRAGSRVIVTLDADGQHDPGEMELLVKPLLEAEADMVQGSRVLGGFEAESRVRTLGVRVFSRILTFLSRTRITDPANGYRAVSPEALRLIDLRQNQFFVSEMILDAVHKGVRVFEVPITVRARARGMTKKGTTFRYALGFTRALVGTWLRQPPVRGPVLEPRWLGGLGAPPPKADELPSERERARTL
jgi:hypothetical protein